MIYIAKLLVLLVAALHIYFLLLEMVLWTKPLGLKTFGNTPQRAADTAVLAANQGSGDLLSFRIDPSSGALTREGAGVSVPAPVSFVFARQITP